MGDERQRAQLSVGTSSEVSLKVSETDMRNLTGTIKSPSGFEEACKLKRLANGHLGESSEQQSLMDDAPCEAFSKDTAE